MRALIIQLLFLLCSSEVFAWSLDPSQYVEPQRNAFRQHVINLYEEKNYSALEELSQSVLEEQSELADGTWLIHELMLAIRKSTNGIQRPKNYFPRLQAWEKAHPNSSIPQLLKADAYRQLAWKARGTGTIDTTHTEGRSKFKELIEKALNALKNSEDLDHPEYYRILLASAKAAQFPKQQLISIFQV
ncbi:MAG: hypothetical protein KDD55_11720, partial [Bdellovibrionales bacterium]|nr:hypothetical protein [Bdellovibrionales bacterium]